MLALYTAIVIVGLLMLLTLLGIAIKVVKQWERGVVL